MATMAHETQNTQQIEKALRGVLRKIYEQGHIEGFASANAPNYGPNNIYLSAFIRPFLESFRGHLRTKYSKDVDIRYSVDCKHSAIKALAIAPEAIALKNRKTIYADLGTLEDVLPTLVPHLASFLVEAHLLTYTEGTPIFMKAISQDYPFAI